MYFDCRNTRTVSFQHIFGANLVPSNAVLASLNFLVIKRILLMDDSLLLVSSNWDAT